VTIAILTTAVFMAMLAICLTVQSTIALVCSPKNLDVCAASENSGATGATIGHYGEEGFALSNVFNGNPCPHCTGVIKNGKLTCSEP
jgi:hypothetical protein